MMQVTMTIISQIIQNNYVSNSSMYWRAPKSKSPKEILMTVKNYPINLQRYLYSLPGYPLEDVSIKIYYSMGSFSKFPTIKILNTREMIQTRIVQNIMKTLRSQMTCLIMVTSYDISLKTRIKKNVFTSMRQVTIIINIFAKWLSVLTTLLSI